MMGGCTFFPHSIQVLFGPWKLNEMEDNLLASILRTNEKIQEYLNDDLEIILANRPVKKDDKNNADGTEGKREQDNKRQMHDDSLIDERYIVSIIGAKQRKSESTMAKQFYIVYEISVTRIADGHTKSVFRRFRDIRTFYYDVIAFNFLLCSDYIFSIASSS